MSRKLKVRIGHSAHQVDPPEVAASWQEAFDSDDQDTIDNWFAANTGWEAYYDPSLERTLVEGDLTPSGNITTTHDGQVIEKIDFDGTSIDVQHDNVIVRGCRMMVRFAATSALFNNPTGNNLTIEYCTFTGPPNLAEQNSNRIFFAKRNGGTAMFTLRFNCVPERGGISESWCRIEETLGEGDGIVLEYNDIRHTGGGSARGTCFAFRCDLNPTGNFLVRRNNVNGWASACITMYNRGITATHPNAIMSDIRWVENVFNTIDMDSAWYILPGDEPNWQQCVDNWVNKSGGTVYGTRMGQGTENGQPTNPIENCVAQNNRWGRRSYPACGQGTPLISSGWGNPTNTWGADNRMLGFEQSPVTSTGDINIGARASWTFNNTTKKWEKV